MSFFCSAKSGMRVIVARREAVISGNPTEVGREARREEGTHEAICQGYNVAMADSLEDIDLAFEVIEELASEFLSRYGLNRDWDL